MKRATAIVVSAVVVTAMAAAALAIILIRAGNSGATLEFSVLDAQSGAWVWDMTARLEERYLKGYYQSDAGPIPFRFTRLAAGDATLVLSAPHYETVRLPVHLKGGVNHLPAPVLMQGLEIPGLDHFLAFESLKGSDLLVQLRPVGSDGKAVLNHPCLPLWVGAAMSVEVKDGAPVQDELETGVSRGRSLFSGPLEWRWDPTPETQFRYSAVIPGSAVAADPAPLRVVDYLIVVPDRKKITESELAALMARVWSLPTMSARSAALAAQGGRLRAFTDTSWNVKGGGQ